MIYGPPSLLLCSLHSCNKNLMASHHCPTLCRKTAISPSHAMPAFSFRGIIDGREEHLLAEQCLRGMMGMEWTGTGSHSLSSAQLGFHIEPTNVNQNHNRWALDLSWCCCPHRTPLPGAVLRCIYRCSSRPLASSHGAVHTFSSASLLAVSSNPATPHGNAIRPFATR
jgi:hypothetical protein